MVKSNLQKELDAFCDFMRDKRKRSQMTLGEIIKRLTELMEKDRTIKVNISSPHSYRGYYHDLAFEQTLEPVPVGVALKTALSALDSIFTGYKGGEFRMRSDAPVWIAFYGYCGPKLLEIKDDGSLVLGEEIEMKVEEVDQAIAEFNNTKTERKHAN